MVKAYNFFIELYALIILLLSPFNTKAKLWIYGRLNWQNKIPPKGNLKRVWVHCASLGEFEQARPLIEQLKQKQKVDLIISFFSPSGYEVRKNYELADYIFYLPADTPTNAKVLIQKLQPDVLIFVKYDLWYNLIRHAKKNNVYLMLVSAVFQDNQIYFKKYGGFFRKILRQIDLVFVQDMASQKLLQKIKVKSIVAGDVRYDRALEVKNTDFTNDFISKFIAGADKVVVFGSTYNIEHHWIKLLRNELNHTPLNYRFIIAPHQVDADHLVQVKQHFPNALYYTLHQDGNHNFNSKTLVLDTMGMLTYMYRFADLAYVGGGFEKSLHNSLEAAVYGKMVIVGPKHLKFPEVQHLVQLGGYLQVNNKDEFNAAIKSCLVESINLGQRNLDYVNEKAGATQKVLDYLLQYLQGYSR